MAVEIRGMPVAASAPRIPLASRLYGLGSVFGKTLRDARVGILVIGALLGVMTVAGGMTMSTTYGTPEARLELAAMSRDMPPMLRGMYGNPVNVDTLGGFISWHYGAYFALLAGLWSILALSSTLAGEARRGSLEFAVATPRSKRSIALEKLGGSRRWRSALPWPSWRSPPGRPVPSSSTLPGDAISPLAAVSFALGLGARALIAGSIAFALAPFLGRGAAAGIAGAVMVGGYVVHSYRTVVPAFDTLANATWFSWTADHVPLAGPSDWAGVALTGVVGVVLLAVGVEAFARRDVGVTIAVPVAQAAPGAPRGPRAGEPIVRRPAADRAGVGHRPRRLRRPDVGRLAVAARRARRLARHGRDLPQPHPGDRHDDRRRVPPARLRGLRLRAHRAGGRDASSRPGRPTRRRAGSSSSWRPRSRASRWAAASGIGRLAGDRPRHRSPGGGRCPRRGLARAGPADPRPRHARARPVRCRPRGDRRGRRRRVAGVVRDARRPRGRDRDVPRRPPRARPAAARLGPAARAHGAPRASRWSARGTRPGSSPASCSRSAGSPSGRGA